jgi:hypothetical protein
MLEGLWHDWMASHWMDNASLVLNDHTCVSSTSQDSIIYDRRMKPVRVVREEHDIFHSS